MAKIICGFFLGTALLFTEAKAIDSPLDYFMEYIPGFQQSQHLQEISFSSSLPQLAEASQPFSSFPIWHPGTFSFLTFFLSSEAENHPLQKIAYESEEESSYEESISEDLIYEASTFGIGMATIFGAGFLTGLASADSIIGFDFIEDLLKDG